MELRCYSYIGGAPPMDSCSLEEKMGVAKQAPLSGLIKAIRPELGWIGAVGWTWLAVSRGVPVSCHVHVWRRRGSLCILITAGNAPLINF